jgi:hypothetical protein
MSSKGPGFGFWNESHESTPSRRHAREREGLLV